MANQAVSHPLLTPALGLAVGILWLWLFPTLVIGVARRGAAAVLMPGILLGLAAQVSLQAALHGLDMPVFHGVGPGVGGLVLAVVLVLSLRAALTAEGAGPDQGSGEGPGWALAAFGPFLLLELTLLVNRGRVSVLSGWDLPVTAGFILLGLAAGCAGLYAVPPLAVAVSGVLAVGTVARPAALTGLGVVLLLPAQVFLSTAMAAALMPAPGIRPGRVYASFAVGAVSFFLLTFLFYRRYGGPELWPVMGTLAVIPAIVTRPFLRNPGALRAAGSRHRRGGRWRPTPSQAVAPSGLKILVYNIHEVFNVWSMPDPEAVAQAIERSGADLVGLQEVGPGWNINGGPDLLAWLRWRFPQYRVDFAPMLGDLVGFAILSRYPVEETGRLPYQKRKSRLSYGLQWATIPTAAGRLFFINTHFSPYVATETDRTSAATMAERVAQANDLLKFWIGRDRTVVVGDLNAGPEEEAIKLMLAAGLVDVSAPHGLAEAFTYDSLRPYERRDYILSSRDVESLAAAIPKTTASDHLPFEARVRLR